MNPPSADSSDAVGAVRCFRTGSLHIVWEATEVQSFSSVNSFLTKKLHPNGSADANVRCWRQLCTEFLFAIILLTLALEMSGCTGSLHLGNANQSTTEKSVG